MEKEIQITSVRHIQKEGLLCLNQKEYRCIFGKQVRIVALDDKVLTAMYLNMYMPMIMKAATSQLLLRQEMVD